MFTTKNPRKIIFEKITELDVFKHYISESFEVGGQNVRSPLRDDDDNPSFGIYMSPRGLRFRDFTTGQNGDAIELVKQMFHIGYNQALLQIDKDFDLNVFHNNTMTLFSDDKPALTGHTTTAVVKKPMTIKCKLRSYTEEDIDYWKQFNISYRTLRYFEIQPISMYKIGREGLTTYTADPLAYRYKIGSRTKIYQPLSEIRHRKFCGNANKNSIQGYDKIDFSKDLLVLTSSFKEVLTLYELGYTAIAPNSESTLIDKWIIDDLKKFFNIVIFYDWDEAGVKSAELHSKAYDIPYVKVIKDEYTSKTKDLSDFSRDYGIIKTFQFTNAILTNKALWQKQ
jgi:hypothetical protein